MWKFAFRIWKSEPNRNSFYRKARYNAESTIKAIDAVFIRDKSGPHRGIDLLRIAQQEVDEAHRRKTQKAGYASNFVQSVSSFQHHRSHEKAISLSNRRRFRCDGQEKLL